MVICPAPAACALYACGQSCLKCRLAFQALFCLYNCTCRKRLPLGLFERHKTHSSVFQACLVPRPAYVTMTCAAVSCPTLQRSCVQRRPSTSLRPCLCAFHENRYAPSALLHLSAAINNACSVRSSRARHALPPAAAALSDAGASGREASSTGADDASTSGAQNSSSSMLKRISAQFKGLQSQQAALQARLQSLGIAGVVAYGLMNTVYYTGAFLAVWLLVAKVPTGALFAVRLHAAV